MASSSGNVPAAHSSQQDSGGYFQIKVPVFDNTVKGFPSFLTKCNIYKAQMRLKGQDAFLGINLLTHLTGIAYRLCEDFAESDAIL